MNDKTTLATPAIAYVATSEQRHRAARLVLGRARDATDAGVILAALGLDPQEAVSDASGASPRAAAGTRR